MLWLKFIINSNLFILKSSVSSNCAKMCLLEFFFKSFWDFIPQWRTNAVAKTTVGHETFSDWKKRLSEGKFKINKNIQQFYQGNFKSVF